MRRKKYWFNRASTVIDGIDDILYDGLKLAYQNNNRDIIYETIDVINKVIDKAIDTGTSVVFDRNLLLIRRLYPLSLAGGELSKYLQETSHRSIRSQISTILRAIDKNGNSQDNDVLVKRFLKYSLTLYNTLLHDILIKNDIETYTKAASGYYDYIFSRLTKSSALNSSNKDEVESDIISIAILQYSWIVYLYKNEKLTLNQCLEFLQDNKLFVRRYERILDTIMYLDNRHLDEFGTSDWEDDIIERNPRSSVAVHRLQTRNWTSFGMMIYLLKKSSRVTKEVNPELIKNLPSYLKIYFNEFQANLEEIKNNKDIWIPIVFEGIMLDSNVDEEFFERIQYVSESLKSAATQLTNIQLIETNRKLANQPFLESKAEEYRNAIGNEWYKESFLHRLFDNYGNCNIVDSHPSIDSLGNSRLEFGMKSKFVDKDYAVEEIHPGFGNRIAIFEDGEFLKNIKKSTDYSFNDIIYCVDKSIEFVKDNQFTPTVIIVGANCYSTLNYSEPNNYFVSNQQLKRKTGDTDIDYSLYRNIPLYVSNNKSFRDYVVVADFENAFTMTQIRNDKWFNRQLQADVTPVDDDEAKKRFEADPVGLKNNYVKGIELSDEEALNLLKSGVLWSVQVRALFEVKNPLAYSIARVIDKEDEEIEEENDD